MSARLGVAVVGLGIGAAHGRAYLATERCQLRWLYDLDTVKARELAADLGVAKVAGHFEQILEDPEVQVISIASYDDAHFGQVVAALEAGKHVFVEKPLCRGAGELGAIKRAWARHAGKLKLATNMVLRKAPLYQWLKENIDAGRFGKLYAFDGDYLYGRLRKITEGWRGRVENYSVMEGGGIHLVDLMLWLSGERPKSVSAAGNRICSQNTAFRYPDYVSAHLRFPSGLVGRVTANFGCVHPHQHVLRLFGTEGTLLSDDAGARWHGSRDPALAASRVDLAALPAGKGVWIGSFVNAVLSDADLSGHTQEIFDALSVCAASDESLDSGKEVEVPYV
jgi:predicted dehydrogenase